MKDRLIEEARKARHVSYAPYSEQKVGAAVLTASGKIYSSGNVENCCYALTICAERGALYHAIASGEHKFKSLAVTNGSDDFILPCGACRQVIWELAGDITIISFNRRGQTRSATLSLLYPSPYKKKAKKRLLQDREGRLKR